MIVPNSRPEATHKDIHTFLPACVLSAPYLVLRRGYFMRTFGVARNTRGVYDDALFVVTPDAVLGFNANGDPSIERPRIARLIAGVYRYKQGIHNISKDPETHPHYPALVQAAPVTITRDGDDHTYTDYFGINVHRGGRHGTSSEGCVTVYPSQWDEFYSLVVTTMARYSRREIQLVVSDRSPID
jgi:hypothetical protein